MGPPLFLTSPSPGALSNHVCRAVPRRAGDQPAAPHE